MQNIYQLAAPAETLSSNAFVKPVKGYPHLTDKNNLFDEIKNHPTQSAFYVNLYRAVIGPSG